MSNNQTDSNQPQEASPLDRLIAACGELDLDTARQLLAGGVAPDTRHIDGTWGAQSQTGPLHAAIEQLPGRYSEREPDARAVPLIRLLLEHRADPNAQRIETNWKGSGTELTAFALAMERRCPEVLALLLQHGADANTPEVRAVHSMRTDGEVVSYPIFQLLRHALDDGDTTAVDAFLAKGADVAAMEKIEMHNERNHNADTLVTVLEVLAGEGIGHPTQGGKRGDDAGDGDDGAAARAEREQRAAALIAQLAAHGAPLEQECRRIRLDRNPDCESDPEDVDDPRAEGYVPRVLCTLCEGRALHSAILARNAPAVRALLAAGAARDAVYTERPQFGDGSTLAVGVKELAELVGDSAVLEALRA